MWHHKLHNGGILIRELADIGSGASMGIAALSQDLTINSMTVSPTFRYEAKNATTGLWTATAGENLTGAGSGGTVGLDTPLLTDDEAVNGETTRYWQAPDTSFADIGTDDFVLELVFKAPIDTSPDGLLVKGDSNNGLLVYTFSNVLRVQLRNNPSFLSPSFNIAPGAFYHILCIADRSGSAIIYGNGIAGSAVSIAAASDISNTVALAIGTGLGVGSATGFNSDILYAALYQQASGWIDTHLQASVAAERFAKLNGTWSDALSKGPDQSLLRNSVATLEKQGQSGGQKLFTVGAYWPRIEKRPDKYGRYAVGYNSEAQHTNLFPYSEDFSNVVWFSLNITKTINDVESPNLATNGCRITESATTGRQYLEDQIGTATGTYTAFIFAKPSGRNDFYISMYSTTDGTAICWFDLSSGVVTQSSGIDTSFVRYIGDGWYLVCIADTRASIETKTVRYGFGNAPGVDSYAGDGRVCGWIFGAQTTATSYPVSYIKTEGATVTRLADTCRYSSLSLPTSGALACDSLVPVGVSGKHLTNLSAGGTNRTSFYLISANRSAFAVVSSGVVGALINGTSGFVSDAWVESRGTFKTDDVRIYENGSQVSSDASADEPVSLTQIDVGGYISGGFELNGLIRLRLFSKPTDKNVTDFGAIMAKSSAYISTPAAVAQSTSYTNIGGTFTEVNSSDFTVSAAGVFTYTGTDTKRFACLASCSASVSTGTPLLTCVWEKNGTAVTSSETNHDVAGAGGEVFSLIGDIELANGDTLNIASKVDTGTPNLTVDTCSVVLFEVS